MGKKWQKLKIKTYNYKKREDTDKTLLMEMEQYICQIEGLLKYNNRLFGKIGHLMTKKFSEIDYLEDIKLLKALLNN